MMADGFMGWPGAGLGQSSSALDAFFNLPAAAEVGPQLRRKRQNEAACGRAPRAPWASGGAGRGSATLPQLPVTLATAVSGGAGRLKATGGSGNLWRRASPPLRTRTLRCHTCQIKIELKYREVTYVTRQTWRWTNWRGHERTAHTSRNLCRNKFGHRGRAYETTRPHPAQGASKIAAAAREPAWISSPPHEGPRPKGRTFECEGSPACSRESPPWQPQN